MKLKDNKPQQIQLQRVVEGTLNNFDGEKVAQSLEENQTLWEGFVFGRFDFGVLIELRDIKSGNLNADTLMILTTKDNLEELLKIIDTWNAVEIGYNYYSRVPITGTDCTETKLFAFGFSPFLKKHSGNLHNNFGCDLDENQVIVRVWWG